MYPDEQPKSEITENTATPVANATNEIPAPRKKFFSGKNKEYLAFSLDLLLNIVIIVGLVFLIRTFVVSPFRVFGPSMCDTLNSENGSCNRSYGEYLIINKFGYQNFLGWQVGLPQRGDIIVFHPPQTNEEYFIKRVIGLPGETVQLKNGKVYIFNKEHPEGYELKEQYLNTINRGNTHPYRDDLTIFEVPKDKYFVMGDNRVASSDSRSCFKEKAGGEICKAENESSYLAMDHIEGKAWVILWPLNKISFVPNETYENSK